jgi:hypothetical protein
MLKLKMEECKNNPWISNQMGGKSSAMLKEIHEPEQAKI